MSVMKTWQTKKLGDISTISSGATPSRMKPDYYSGGTIPWVKSGELINGEINDTEELITSQAIDDARLKILPQGTPVLAMYGATAGTAAILNINATTNQAVAAIQPDTNVLDPRYVFYFLKFKKTEFISKRLGGAQPNISQKTIKTLKIPIPPITKQLQIVDRLDAIRKLQELNNKEIEKAEELFDSFVTVSLKPKEEWKCRSLGEILSFEYGKGLPERVRVSGNVPVYGSNGLVGTHNIKLVGGPGIIVGRKGSIGEVTWSNCDFWPIDTTYYIKLQTNEDLRFIFFLLRTLNLTKLNKASGVPGLNRNDVYVLKVFLPSITVQKRIAGHLNNINELRERKEVEKEKLSEFFESTLSKLMRPN